MLRRIATVVVIVVAVAAKTSSPLLAQGTSDRQRNFQDQLTGQLETGSIKNEANPGYCQQHDVSQVTCSRSVG
ncbi:MAG: hypothetical protein ABI868_04105 [Acidobacteriota bacterium]